NAVTPPFGVRTIMNPPPPILPALGCVTASANAVATAASTAFPPRARIEAPASQAVDDVQTTTPSLLSTPRSLVPVPVETVKRNGTATISERTRIRTSAMILHWWKLTMTAERH